MKHLSNNKGYSLLITMGILVIFTLLGLTLLMLSSNGILRNETRNDIVKSTDLADKGIDYLKKEIELVLSEKLKEDKKDANVNLKLLFDSTFINSNNNKYFCSTDLKSGVSIINESGDATYSCIMKPASATDSNYVINETTRSVFIRSTGFTNNKAHTTNARVEFSFSTVPSQLSYAVSTNKEGDLYFFGGTDITGNIKVAGDLLVSQHSFRSTINNSGAITGNTFIRSTPVKLMSPSSNGISNIILNEGDPLNNVQAKKVYSIPQSSITENKLDINALLEGNPANGKSAFAKDITNNEQAIKDLFLHKDHPLTKGLIDEVKLPNTPRVVKVPPIQDDSVKVVSAVDDIGASNARNINKTTRSLTFSGKDLVANPGSGRDTYYIAGNLSLTEYEYGCGFLNWRTCTARSNIKLTGNYYVNGNLTITDVNLFANAIIYVKGSVTIRESEIKKLNNSGNLFIFAENNIKISNISEGSAEANSSEIDGFFYSNNNFLMYGVGSNIKIVGGLSAKNTILTSLRGNSYDNGKITETVPNVCRIDIVTSMETPQIFSNATNTREWIRLVDKVYNRNGNRYVKVEAPFANPNINHNWANLSHDYVFLKRNTTTSPKYRYLNQTENIKMEEWKYIIDLANDFYYLPFTQSPTSHDLDIERLAYINGNLKILLENWNGKVKNIYQSFNYLDSNGKYKSTTYSSDWSNIYKDLSSLSNYIDTLILQSAQINYNCWEYYEDIRGNLQGDSLYTQLNSNGRIKIQYNHDLIKNFIENRSFEHINIEDISVMPSTVKEIKYD